MNPFQAVGAVYRDHSASLLHRQLFLSIDDQLIVPRQMHLLPSMFIVDQLLQLARRHLLHLAFQLMLF